MTDLETLANLREVSIFTKDIAERVGCEVLAAIAQDIHDEAGDLIIELIGESK